MLDHVWNDHDISIHSVNIIFSLIYGQTSELLWIFFPGLQGTEKSPGCGLHSVVSKWDGHISWLLDAGRDVSHTSGQPHQLFLPKLRALKHKIGIIFFVNLLTCTTRLFQWRPFLWWLQQASWVRTLWFSTNSVTTDYQPCCQESQLSGQKYQNSNGDVCIDGAIDI